MMILTVFLFFRLALCSNRCRAIFIFAHVAPTLIGEEGKKKSSSWLRCFLALGNVLINWVKFGVVQMISNALTAR